MGNTYHINKSYMQNPLKFGSIYMFQIGRRFCDSDTVVDTHVHTDLFELTVVTDGRGVVTTNGVAVPVERGDIYLSFPCDAHKIVSDAEKTLKYDFFAFHSEHAVFKKEEETYTISDNNSTNGTFVNGERIGAEPCALKTGDLIKIGQLIFIFVEPTEDE